MTNVLADQHTLLVTGVKLKKFLQVDVQIYAPFPGGFI